MSNQNGEGKQKIKKSIPSNLTNPDLKPESTPPASGQGSEALGSWGSENDMLGAELYTNISFLDLQCIFLFLQ